MVVCVDRGWEEKRWNLRKIMELLGLCLRRIVIVSETKDHKNMRIQQIYFWVCIFFVFANVCICVKSEGHS